MKLPESCFHILSRCPDSPDISSIDAAIRSLQSLKALNATSRHEELILTPLGKNLAALPCSPKVGRLLIYGSLLSCTLPCSFVAASITSKSPFMTSSDPEVRKKVAEAKKNFAKSAGRLSDHFAVAEACRIFVTMQQHRLGQSHIRKYCSDNGLSFDTMTEIITMQKDLLQGLVDLGFASSVNAAMLETADCNKHCRDSKVLSAAFCAGFYPQIARVMKPPTKYVETMGSAFQRENEARELKLYIPEKPDEGFSADKSTDDNGDTRGLQRVWVHPSSVNFHTVSFGGSFVIYSDRQITSKPYLREISEVTAYPILFFGGSLEPNYSTGLVTIDRWIRFSAPGKIVALVQGIRDTLDQLLDSKIADPSIDIFSNSALQAVVKLISSDGIAKSL